MNAGTLSSRTNSIAASVARQVQTWLPSSTHGFSACTTRSASRSMASGSPALRVDAR
jgi:hypothetical protein